MTTYKFTLGIGYARAEHEEEMTIDDMGYTDEEWNNLTEDQREDELLENWKDWSNNYIDGGWRIVE
jgi:hypothetical protein